MTYIFPLLFRVDCVGPLLRPWPMNETTSSPPANPVAVSIVEDHRRMREGFAALLNRAAGVRCVSVYGSGEEAVREMPGQKPDVALVDINLPGMNGIECVSRLKERLPQLQILMLTRYEQSDLIFPSLRAGASGYLLKSVPPAELVQAIKDVHVGGSPMSMQIARKVVGYFREFPRATSDFERLTPREQELLELLAQGYSYKEMADRVGICLSTVRTHLHAVYQKLHVRTRIEATVKFNSKGPSPGQISKGISP